MQFSNLRARLGTAAILVAGLLAILIVSAYYCFGRWLLSGAAFIVSGLCSAEFAALCTKKKDAFDGYQPSKLKGLVYFILCLLPPISVLYLLSQSGLCDLELDRNHSDKIFLSAVFASVCGSVLTLVVAGRRSLEFAQEIGSDLFAGVYHVGICGGLLFYYTLFPWPQLPLTWLFLCVALNDTAAYFVGSKVGGPKLCPTISPNKTISGSIGGLFVGTCVGVLTGSGLGYSGDSLQLLFLSMAVAVSCQAGDLLKSYLKRLHGVKDSGNILPGHGGLYDRLDGVLFCIPLVFIWY